MLRRTAGVPQVVAGLAAGFVVLLLVLVIVRLPWAGDLGVHAATVQRLRHSLVDPGNPLGDADTPSPHYSPWVGYHWVTPWVKYGDVVMARTVPARQIPAYGAYTVAPGYPDFFLPDEGRREAAVRRYFAVGTSVGVRRGFVEAYRVQWVVDRGVGRREAGVRVVAWGPGGEVFV
ncbi:hypothetical protein ACGFWF_33510 [Streptomyces sp. NPDC048581]|uniref:hypothetical protein n=1 Tax=Streptomyces sp. NPDC048581 TaxID=3365572 RepID=UPI003721C4C4